MCLQADKAAAKAATEIEALNTKLTELKAERRAIGESALRPGSFAAATSSPATLGSRSFPYPPQRHPPAPAPCMLQERPPLPLPTFARPRTLGLFHPFPLHSHIPTLRVVRCHAPAHAFLNHFPLPPPLTTTTTPPLQRKKVPS